MIFVKANAFDPTSCKFSPNIIWVGKFLQPLNAFALIWVTPEILNPTPFVESEDNDVQPKKAFSPITTNPGIIIFSTLLNPLNASVGTVPCSRTVIVFNELGTILVAARAVPELFPNK